MSSTRTPRGPTRALGIHFSEAFGLRHLHVGGSAIQSAMRLDAPDDLALAYNAEGKKVEAAEALIAIRTRDARRGAHPAAGAPRGPGQVPAARARALRLPMRERGSRQPAD